MDSQVALQQIRSILGPRGWIDQPDALQPYLEERRGNYRSVVSAVALPADTGAVATIVRLCAESGIAIVPQGGNTGLCGGAVADGARPELLVNMQRMNRIREIDPVNDTLTAEAGCVLAHVQEAAHAEDRLFPLSLGAEGSCQIGGNLSTNAGGINVLRYGNARELTLGVEVVLADGRVWNGLNRLRKNNTGYDLKDLFVGAEGTLGIITAAVVKLFPLPQQRQTALIAVSTAQDAIELLSHARSIGGENLTSFELMSATAVGFARSHINGIRPPFDPLPPWSILLELSGDLDSERLRAQVERLLSLALETGLIDDAALATSETQSLAFWRIREAVVEAQPFEGASIKHDVSVPISSIPKFLAAASAAVEATVPGCRPCAFGHLGDGNIHYNISQPPGMNAEDFVALRSTLNDVVHDIVMDMQGSFSAEHGIGRLKIPEMLRYKAPLELELMQKVKYALDPCNVFNPGKVLGKHSFQP